jgi:hypothetical protein
MADCTVLMMAVERVIALLNRGWIRHSTEQQKMTEEIVFVMRRRWRAKVKQITEGRSSR